MDLLIFPILLAGMWFLLVRPQQKRVRAQRDLIASVAVGDEVVTAGGIIGTIRVLTDDRVFLEVAPGVELRILRGAISRTIDPATAEVLEPEETLERREDDDGDEPEPHQ
jgi:preprotein translocase subunit YajC